VFVIFVLCIVLSVYVLFCVFCVLCIVVPLPPGTYPLEVNNNNNNNNNNIIIIIIIMYLGSKQSGVCANVMCESVDVLRWHEKPNYNP
jgi:hypothetical protein